MPQEYSPAELGAAIGSLIGRGHLGLVLIDRPDAPPHEVRTFIEEEIARRRQGTPIDAPEIFGSTIGTSFVAG